MLRIGAAIVCLLLCRPSALPQTANAFPYDEARKHEIKPHRRSVPVEGVQGGFNQLALTLSISPAGDVTHAEAKGDSDTLKFWHQLEGEVSQWRFTPFEVNGQPVTATIEEYIDLVPPGRLPPSRRLSGPPCRQYKVVSPAHRRPLLYTPKFICEIVAVLSICLFCVYDGQAKQTCTILGIRGIQHHGGERHFALS